MHIGTLEDADPRFAAGIDAFRKDDRAAAAAAFEELLAAARTVHDDRAAVLGMTGLARLDLRAGDLPAVRRRCEEALGLSDDLDPEARWHPLHLLAACDRMEGRHAQAVERYRETLELSTAMGNDRRVTMETMNLSAAERGLGRLDDAEAHLREALGRALDAGEDGVVPFCVLGFAGIAAEREKAERTGTLIGAIDVWLEGAGQALDPDDAPDFERAVERGRATDADAFDRGRERGHAMSIPAAALLALGSSG